MIVLLIGTLVLGFSAPMISKQLKHNDFTSIQTQILNKKIENVKDKSDANAGKISQIIGTKTPSDYATYIKGLETDINNLLNNQNIKDVMAGVKNTDYDDDIENLQAQIDTKVSTESLTDKIAAEISKLEEKLKSKFVPSGAVMFFNLESCPVDWYALNSGGAFIRDVGGYAAQIGQIQNPGLPNLKGWNGVGDDGKADGTLFKINTSKIGGDSGDGSNDYAADFDASRYNSIYSDNINEVRPKNITLLACVKR